MLLHSIGRQQAVPPFLSKGSPIGEEAEALSVRRMMRRERRTREPARYTSRNVEICSPRNKPALVSGPQVFTMKHFSKLPYLVSRFRSAQPNGGTTRSESGWLAELSSREM